ncbi:MAG: NAD(P)/FAD-dependent oxidoreductase [Clostridiales bacterium]|nr:NAD(P)/FAD-dependent oxidoreductase [Clostridiales bacterium]
MDTILMQSQYDIIVVGGGAAGLMAAGTAASCGRRVLLAEKNQRLGRKLLITGKGRCNITNNCDLDTLMQNIPTNNKFLYSAFRHFSPADTIRFFEQRGLPVKTERGNRVFPESDKAADVADVLIKYCKSTGVTVVQEEVSAISVQNGKAAGILCKSGNKYTADAVIVTTGGLSYPLTGSTGDGYRFAKSVGHTVVPPVPSLVPLIIREEWCKQLQGLSLKNVTLTVKETQTGKELYSELGEMLFTHFGISGPLVLSCSAHMRNLTPGKYQIYIDCKPGLDEKQLDNRLLRDFQKYQNRDFSNALHELLPQKLIPVFIKLCRLPPDKKVNQLSKEDRRVMIEQLKRMKLTVDGFRPITEAIITSGGVKTAEINPKTMESKCCSGLYFAGEVIDVDAYTGGFNLQIAFSTGYLAGISASENII